MFTFLLAALLLQPQEPVKVSALLSNDRPVVGEPTMLRITIETRDTVADRIVDPVMPAGIEVVETQDYTETRISFPGGRNHVTERRLILVARVPGQFTIPAATVHAAGRVWVTRALPITVADTPDGTRPPIDSRIDVVITPDRVYVGQQVLLEATAAFSRGLRSQQTRPATYQAPSPAGFWIHDVPEPLSVGMRTIDGELYETQTFRRVYFPITAGTFRLPPAKLQFELRRGFLSSAETYDLVSDSPSIEVLPIPEEARPPSFRGAVGQYTVRASVAPSTVSVGEAATLVVEIEGLGNVKALPPPPLPDLPGVEAQPPTEDAEADVRGSSIGGVKRFTWVLVPQRPGSVTVAPIEYAFFDPQAERFGVAHTEPVSFDVSGSATADRAAPGLAPLARARSTSGFAVVRSPVFLLAQLAPLLLLVWAFNRRGRPTHHAAKRAGRRHPDRLAPLRHAAESDASFWPRFDHAVRAAAADALGEPALTHASTSEIASAMTRHRVPVPAATTITELLGSAERLRFARTVTPGTNRSTAIERAERAIRAIERVEPDSAAGALVLVLTIAGTLAGSPLRAGQADPSSFQQAIEAYDRGDFLAAAAAFERHLEQDRGDANAWYNLGNTRWAAGDRGHAIHAWLQAVRLAPGHSAARQNLEAMVGPGVSTFMPPRFALTPVQAVLAFAVAWWLAAIAIAIRVTRRRSILPVIIIAGLAVIGATAATLLGLTGNDAAVVVEETQLVMAPALKADALGAIPAGTLLHVLEQRDGWARVRVGGTEGWAEMTTLAQ
ncbi:MAG: BatD family protein [Longimicrobiales bacterium]